MFLAEFALAMVSRFAPQIQVFILAMPIKSILAIFVLIFSQRAAAECDGQLSSSQGYAVRSIPCCGPATRDPGAAEPGRRQAMSGDSGEKTELPTPKRIRDARQKGQVARSQEVVTTVSLLAVVAFIWEPGARPCTG